VSRAAARAAPTTASPAPTETPTPTPPVARAKDAPSPPPDAPTATPTSPEDAPGGAGDEEAAHVPVELTVHPDGQVTPKTVSVPAFLALELEVTNRTAAPISVSMEDVTGEFEVEPGARATRRVEGKPRGRYEVRVTGGGSAVVVSGVEPEP
jgi:hypothetical protein